jgi:hypothetical protein
MRGSVESSLYTHERAQHLHKVQDMLAAAVEGIPHSPRTRELETKKDVFMSHHPSPLLPKRNLRTVPWPETLACGMETTFQSFAVAHSFTAAQSPGR